MEDNQLIAEFMGWKKSVIDTLGNVKVMGYYVESVPHKQTMYGEPYADIDNLKFNESWDWLMPVVKKCHEVSGEMQNKFNNNNTESLDDSTGWRAWSYRHVKLYTDIRFVYNDAVSFIKWYNKNK